MMTKYATEYDDAISKINVAKSIRWRIKVHSFAPENSTCVPKEC